MKKSCIRLIAIVVLITMTCSCTSCNNSNTEQSSHQHEYGDWVTIEEATCEHEGKIARYCECGDEQEKVVEAKDHTYDENGVCTVCGYIRTAAEATNSPAIIDYDVYGKGVANWVDEVLQNDSFSISGNGEGAEYLKNNNYTLSFTYNCSNIVVRGWIGFEDAITQMGYMIDNGEPAYVSGFDSEGTEDAIKTVAGANATRYMITIPTESLGVGTHTITLVAKTADGSVIKLNGAYKEATMKDNIPYNGNIISTITYKTTSTKPASSEMGEIVCEQAKIVADFCRLNGFTYGDAAINPAINWKDLSASTAINSNQKKFSCDRLVCWALYRAGYTDQPYTQGLVVYAPGGNDLTEYCEKWGFVKITNWSDLQKGDIVFVGSTRPEHVYIFYSWADSVGGVYNYRFDGGSNWRIQQVQPYLQSYIDADENFLYAMRPV